MVYGFEYVRTFVFYLNTRKTTDYIMCNGVFIAFNESQPYMQSQKKIIKKSFSFYCSRIKMGHYFKIQKILRVSFMTLGL